VASVAGGGERGEGLSHRGTILTLDGAPYGRDGSFPTCAQRLRGREGARRRLSMLGHEALLPLHGAGREGGVFPGARERLPRVDRAADGLSGCAAPELRAHLQAVQLGPVHVGAVALLACRLDEDAGGDKQLDRLARGHTTLAQGVPSCPSTRARQSPSPRTALRRR
jgi:hypothetical protein